MPQGQTHCFAKLNLSQGSGLTILASRPQDMPPKNALCLIEHRFVRQILLCRLANASQWMIFQPLGKSQHAFIDGYFGRITQVTFGGGQIKPMRRGKLTRDKPCHDGFCL